ncbi:MAG: methyltransferase domain-containing protein [Methylobacterium sp.]|uniref:SAM-dependent methyltransferase n=1 Tax=Methylobacterium sp. TaxID=409 RepID=UPI00258C01C6|nr:class I SAM-dependent methyltransferase [Methylobacterium sp.]MBY0298683.1 methyltransferase domain-containing protein [Methylobacterium sp.]
MTEQRIIDPALQDFAMRLGGELGVNGRIHDGDFIFWFVHDISPADAREGAVRAYHLGGRHDAEFLGDVLQQHKMQKDGLSILDFASGYGRVSRHIARVVPHAQVHACDIHDDAVRFLESIGIPSFISHVDPDKFTAPQTYDVIFVLSLFTHLPRRTWGRWLKVLADCLNPGGLLVFSAHGPHIWRHWNRCPLDADGYVFHSGSEQKDLSSSDYGNTLTMPEYVINVIRANRLHLESYRSAGIGDHDVYVIRAVDDSLRLPSPEELAHQHRLHVVAIQHYHSKIRPLVRDYRIRIKRTVKHLYRAARNRR